MRPRLSAIQAMPTEEHVLWCAKVAKKYLHAGWTSCVGAACAKPRLDVVIRNAINSGQIPGPRYLAASQEITVPGGLGDETLPHLPFPEFSFGVNVNGAEDMRKVVRMFLKYGVDSIKLNLSGDNFTPDSPAQTTWMTDAEVAAAMEEVRMRGKRGTAHARSAASVKQALRHGMQVIYHASFTDTETLDMLEEARDRVFVAPGLAILYAMLNESEPWGISNAKAVSMGYQIEWDAAIESLCDDAQARRARAARRRLRLRVHAARPERARPGILRQVPGHDADGGDPLGDDVRRPDHAEAATNSAS